MQNSEGSEVVIKKIVAFPNRLKVAKYFTPSRGMALNEVFKTFYSKVQNQVVKKPSIIFLVAGEQ